VLNNGRPRSLPPLVLSPDDPAADAAAAVVAYHARAIAAEREAAIIGDIEAIHRMRVATRRLRAALKLLNGVLPREVLDTAPRELAKLANVIGAVRDRDVMLQTVQRRARRLDPQFIEALAPINDAIRTERALAHTKVLRLLTSQRYRALIDRLSAIAPRRGNHDDEITLGAVAAGLIRPIVKATFKAGARLDGRCPPEALHRLRIRAKRMRYALEGMRALGGKGLRKTVTRLEALQEELGAYHDTDAAISWLRSYITAPDPRDPFTVAAAGALIHSLQRRSRKLRERCLREWRHLDLRTLAHDTLDELVHESREFAVAQAAQAAPDSDLAPETEEPSETDPI